VIIKDDKSNREDKGNEGDKEIGIKMKVIKDEGDKDEEGYKDEGNKDEE